MNFQEIDKIKLKQEHYYLIQNSEWSPSGYAIAQYDNKQLICENCQREIPRDEIERICELDKL